MLRTLVLAGALVASGLACSGGTCPSTTMILCGGKSANADVCLEDFAEVASTAAGVENAANVIVNGAGGCIVGLGLVLQDARQLASDHPRKLGQTLSNTRG